MYAVVKTGGKQYRVTAGEKLKIEQIPADIGSEIVLDQVLMVADGDNVSLGNPLVAGAAVNARIIAHGRGEKIRIFKMRRRKLYRKTQGHRQNYTEIEVLGISA
jgi:large subunit ribosomal protein L21